MVESLVRGGSRSAAVRHPIGGFDPMPPAADLLRTKEEREVRRGGRSAPSFEGPKEEPPAPSDERCPKCGQLVPAYSCAEDVCHWDYPQEAPRG